MPIILALLVLYFPRLMILYLRFFTDWFSTGPNWFWGILGFICAPFTLLWYSAVQVWFGGRWDIMQVILLVIAIVIDLGGGFGATRQRK
jgi:hypothetical protein